MKKNNEKELYFDEFEYKRLKENTEKLSKYFDDAVSALDNEGVTLTEEAIKENMLSDEAFTAYITAQAKLYLGSLRGLLPKETRQRVQAEYQALNDRCLPHVRTIQSYFTNHYHLLTFADGKPYLDPKKAESWCREEATQELDSVLADKYFSALQAIGKAIEDAEKIEQEHNLTKFARFGKTYFLREETIGDNRAIGLMTEENFFSKELTRERFLETFVTGLTKK